MPTALWNAKGTDVTKNSILDVKGDLRSAHDYSYYYRYFSNWTSFKIHFSNHSRVQIFLLDFFFVSNSIITLYDVQKDIYAISSLLLIFATIKLYIQTFYLLYFLEGILRREQFEIISDTHEYLRNITEYNPSEICIRVTQPLIKNIKYKLYQTLSEIVFKTIFLWIVN